MKKVYSCQQTDEMANLLKRHGVLVFPTDTVYGVGIRYGCLEDLQKLKKIKKRPETKPIPMMVSDIEMAKTVVQVDDRAQKIIEHFLPGPLTLILPIQEGIDTEWFNGNHTVALRIPNMPYICEMIQKCQAPCMVSSANLSSEPAALTLQEALEALPDADGFVEGVCENKIASTILDCSQEQLRILRPGPISLEEIEKVLIE